MLVIIFEQNFQFSLVWCWRQFRGSFPTAPAFPTLTKAVIYKRFIDDIILLQLWKTQRQRYQAFENSIGNVGFKITTKSFNTKFTDQKIEFLDVLHKHSSKSLFKFVTCNYVKKIATDRTFINGTSYHLIWVFQSIVVFEAMRERRICKVKPGYYNCLEHIKANVFNLNFLKLLHQRWLSRPILGCIDFILLKNQIKKLQQNKIIEVTHFPKLLQSRQRQKLLQSNVMLAYKRPQT